MTDKQIIIDVCPYQGECSVSGCKRNDDGCFVRQLFEERNRAENRIVELNKSIQAKEQECESLKEQIKFQNNFIDSLLKATNNSEWLDKSILDDEASEIIEKIELDYEQLDQLKAENEGLKIYIESNEQQVKEVEILVMDNDRLINELNQLKQTLTEIKPILELYANSKVGEEQPDGTYKLSSGIWDSFGFCTGFCTTTTYDPRPARQALQKISECEVSDGNN